MFVVSKVRVLYIGLQSTLDNISRNVRTLKFSLPWPELAVDALTVLITGSQNDSRLERFRLFHTGMEVLFLLTYVAYQRIIYRYPAP